MVAKDARRQGVGRAFLEATVDWRAAGVRKLEPRVFAWNEPAIRLYEQFGFEREGHRKGQLWRSSTRQECGCSPSSWRRAPGS
jgi:RimJ/RimL family protein N-acetyltransferase